MSAEKTRRPALAKEHFCEGTRQQWSLIYLIFVCIIMVVDASVEHFDPTKYLEFLTFSYPFLITGITVSSYNKEKASMFGQSSEGGTTVSSTL